MGYWTSFYSVNLDDVKRVFGGRDRALQTEIERASREEIRSSDRYFANLIRAGAPALGEAVAGLFNGSVSVKYSFQYWYACQLVCRHLGEILNDGDDVSFISALEFETPLANPRLFLPLGKPDDFPEVSFLSREEIRENIIRARQHQPDSSRVDLEQWQAFCKYLEAARQRGRDLVTFTH
jgi:hypothetical protein